MTPVQLLAAALRWRTRQDKAVRKWQDDNGLEVDGVLNPGGPTISSMKKATGSLLGGFTAPTADEVDQHHAQRQQGEEGLLNTRPARLSMPKPAQPFELDDTSLAFNRDTANAMTRSTVDGQIPDIYGNYLSQAGAAAHPTIMDLAEQVDATSGRDRADRVLHGIIGKASPDQVEGLLGGPPPAPRPIGVRLADLPDDGDVPLFRETSDFGDLQTASAGMPNQALAEDEPPTPEPPPEPTPPTPPEKPDPEKPGPETPEPPPEDSDCQELYDAFFEAQDERDAAQQEVDELQDTLNQVEAEIAEVSQQIAEALSDAGQGWAEGWRDGTMIPLPPPLGKIGKVMGRLNKPGQAIGGFKGSYDAAKRLETELVPKRSELEAGRKALLKQLNEAEKALAEAQSALDSAADEYRQCREEDEDEDEEPPDDKQ